MADDTLTVVRGDTFGPEVAHLSDNALADYNLTGTTIWFTVKEWDAPPVVQPADDANALVKLYWVSGGANSGIAVADPTSGDIAVTIPATLTANLAPGRAYRYDVQMKLADGRIKTVKLGALNVVADVTNRVTTP
jgi:hypothetical protein